MSKDVNKVKTYVAKPSQPLRKDIGEFVLSAGAGGLVLYGLAAMLPFITFLPLLLVAVVLGGIMYFGGNDE